MNGFLDGSLVGLLLIAGFGYAIYALGPKSLRARSLAGAAALLGRLPLPGLRGLAGRLAAAAASRTGAACGGCGTCGSSQKAPDVRIPLSKIGRRL